MDEHGQFHIAHYDSENDDLSYSTGVPNGQWNTELVDASGHTGKILPLQWMLQIICTSSTPVGRVRFEIRNHRNDPHLPLGHQDHRLGPNVGEGNSNAIFIDNSGMIHVAFNDDTATF